AQARTALAGRSREKLERVRADLGQHGEGWGVIAADAADDSALREMAAQGTVVATTVGPYTSYGFPLAAACADAGTHYADRTGEVLFMRRTAEELHERAAA